MGPSMRREVITQFCLRLLEDYKAIFQPPKEASGLETAERRYTWLKRTLREYNERYATHFPEAWRVPCGLCEHFCHVTRQHLVEVLGACHHTVNPELMIRVLRKSIEFENDLARRYPADAAPQTPSSPSAEAAAAAAPGLGFKYPDVLSQPKGPSSAGAAADEFAPQFRGIVSACFDAYLGSWVQHEEKHLIEVLEKATAAGTDKVVAQEDEEEEGAEPRYLYSSAPDLFTAMKVSMSKCVDFSTHQTLFDVFQVFRKVVARYCEALGAQLPSKIVTALPADGVRGVCCVIGTSEYCDEILPQLVESVLRVIDPAFEARVTFAAEQELVDGTISRAMQVLVQSCSVSCDEVFSRMTRTNWAQFNQAVSDQSAFVGEVSERLSSQFVPIARHLSKQHYRFFCDKFVQAFITRFVAEIYSCRKISELGAQQLLLDTAAIKLTLLEVPVVAGNGRQMSTAYSNFVLREMGRAETMLKVLSSPGDVDAEAVGALLSDGGRVHTESEVDRILALRAAATDGSPAESPRAEEAGRFLTPNIQQGLQAAQDLKRLSSNVSKKLLGNVNLSSFNPAGRK